MSWRSSRNDSSAPTWHATTRKAPWWSAGAGTCRGYVNGEAVTPDTTRREARRIARREAQRREREEP